MGKEDAQIRQLLAELALTDSEPAFKALFHAYANRIMRFVLLFINSYETAEEITEDTFVALWMQRKMLTEINDFNAWIYAIARFKTYNYLRANRPEFLSHDEIPIDLFASVQTTPEDDCISKEIAEAANRAIEQLSPKAKMVFKLVREDGMKYKDAAEYMGITVKTVEAHMAAAMKHIAKILEKKC
jgi:RNA polymerase sigma-70 factor (ECF subfamily)